MSLIYFLIILLLSWIFYTVMTRDEDAVMSALKWLVPTLYILFLMLPIYWLLSMSFKTTNEILGGFTLWPQQLHARELPQDLHRPDLVHGLRQLADLRGDQHGDLGRGRAAGGLRVLALPLPRRQAPVLLAADQPHGAGRGVRAAVLPALLGGRPVRHPHRGGAGALPVQHPARGLDPRRLHVRRAEGARRDRLRRRLLRSGASSSRSSCRPSPPASASRRSSASCSPGSSCCSPRR